MSNSTAPANLSYKFISFLQLNVSTANGFPESIDLVQYLRKLLFGAILYIWLLKHNAGGNP